MVIYAWQENLQGLTYWWFPDTMFATYNPTLVTFPAYDPAEKAQDIHRTGQRGTHKGGVNSGSMNWWAVLEANILTKKQFHNVSSMWNFLFPNFEC